ncbi:hypothetical protein MLD38_014882 [Melastoma candidum]|uniref:Uncharacterized protein n=1 Tax=Melastoma candidum TaxID=119954 RepID=A0ACB9RG32_9MYRT|nr:hypothetical protein MLD38_014882 [Melastoma candidum]
MVGGGLMLEKEGSEVGGEVGVEEDGGAEEAVVNAEEAVVNALTKSTELLSYDGLVGSDKSGLDFDEEVKRRRLEAREGLLAHLAQDDLRDEDEFEKKKQREGLKGEITISKNNAYTVGDFMTRKEDLHIVKPNTTVDKALEMLVENRITGFPVVDDDWKLVGLVSD